MSYSNFLEVLSQGPLECHNISDTKESRRRPSFVCCRLPNVDRHKSPVLRCFTEEDLSTEFALAA